MTVAAHKEDYRLDRELRHHQYYMLLLRLNQNPNKFQNFQSSQIPFLHISLYTLAVACFYFLCWTPFWMATLFAVYLENSANSSSVPPVFVYIMYFIHALPFTNSAINWILYGRVFLETVS